jgi:YD repeat-containing protein
MTMGCGLASVSLTGEMNGGDNISCNADNAQTKFNSVTLGYDTNGNLTSDGTNTYTYDARNHLTGISGGSTASFVYDPFGRRQSKTIGGTTTQFLYDGLNPVQELSASNAVNATLLNGLAIDERFARKDTAVSTYLNDALGSAVALVKSGDTARYIYAPFGAASTFGTSSANSYQFTGSEAHRRHDHRRRLTSSRMGRAV